MLVLIAVYFLIAVTACAAGAASVVFLLMKLVRAFTLRMENRKLP